MTKFLSQSEESRHSLNLLFKIIVDPNLDIFLEVESKDYVELTSYYFSI